MRSMSSSSFLVILDGVYVVGFGVDVGIGVLLLMRSKISAGNCGMPFNHVNGFLPLILAVIIDLARLTITQSVLELHIHVMLTPL